MGSDIDDLFNEIMEWGVEDIRALWHHNAFLIEKNYPPKSEIEIENKKEIFAAATKGQDFSKWNNIQKAKLIVVCRFLHIKNSEITSLVKIDIPNCPVLKEVIGLLPKRTKGEISNLQLFYALHTEYTVVKVTWENVTSSWGPKVILTDSANKKYYYLFKNRTPEFEKDMKKYNKAAQLGWREQYTSTYEYEACCGGELSIASVGATQKCELLTTKFKNAVTTLTLDESKVRLKIVFGAIIDAYLYFELDLMTTDNEEFRKTFPRLALDFESIVNKIGEYIILPIIKIDTQQFHVVHGDEWGGNFLFSEMEDSVFFIDFEDALYCEVGTKTVIKVGGDLSSRIFYDEKSNEDDNFSIFGMGICGSMGRLLAALIQYEEDISADRFKMIIEQFLKCFSDKLVEKRPAYRMYAKHLESQILAYAWDWGIYWNVKTRWRSGTFDRFETIIKELLLLDSNPQPPPIDLGINSNKDWARPTTPLLDDAGLEEEDEEMESLFEGAMDLYEEEEYDKAISGLEEFLERYYECEGPLKKSFQEYEYISKFKIGLGYYRLKQLEKGIVQLKAAIEDGFSGKWGYHIFLLLAEMLGESGEYEDAKLYVIRALQHRSDYDGGGVESKDIGMDTWADDWYLFGDLGNEPDLVQIKLNFAFCLQKAKEYGRAIKFFGAILKWYFDTKRPLDVQTDTIRMCLGIAHSKNKSYEKAEQLELACLEYREGENDFGEISKAQRNLGQNYQAWGKFDEAMEYYGKAKQCIKLNPNVSVSDGEEWLEWIQQKIEECQQAVGRVKRESHFKNSQYNILKEATVAPLLPRRKTKDRQFENLVQLFEQKKTEEEGVKYCRNTMIPYAAGQQNREMEYFATLHVILHDPLGSSEEIWTRILELGKELQRETGDYLYYFASLNSVFIASFESINPVQEQKYYDELYKVPMDDVDFCSSVFLNLARYNRRLSRIERAEQLLDYIKPFSDLELLIPLIESHYLVTRCQNSFDLGNLEHSNELAALLVNSMSTLDLSENRGLFSVWMELLEWYRYSEQVELLGDAIRVLNKFQNEMDSYDKSQLNYFTGWLEVENEHFQEAKKFFELAIEDGEGYGVLQNPAYFMIGQIQQNEGNIEEAVINFRRAIELDPREERHSLTYKFLAECYYGLDQKDLAEESAKRGAAGYLATYEAGPPNKIDSLQHHLVCSMFVVELNQDLELLKEVYIRASKQWGGAEFSQEDSEGLWLFIMEKIILVGLQFKEKQNYYHREAKKYFALASEREIGVLFQGSAYYKIGELYRDLYEAGPGKEIDHLLLYLDNMICCFKIIKEPDLKRMYKTASKQWKKDELSLVDSEQLWKRLVQIKNLGQVLPGKAKYYNADFGILKRLKKMREDNNSIETDMSSDIDSAIEKRNAGDYPGAMKLLDSCIEEFKITEEYSLLAETYKEFGTTYLDMEKFVLAGKMWEEAMDLYIELDDQLGEADCLMNLALVSQYKKRVQDMRAKYEQCRVIYKKLGEDEALADIDSNLADVEFEQGNYEEALQLIDACIKSHNRNSKSPKNNATAYNIRGNICSKLNRVEEAKKSYEGALGLAEKVDPVGHCDVLCNLGRLYLSQGDYTQAEVSFRKHLNSLPEDIEPDPWFKENNLLSNRMTWTKFPPADDSLPDFK